jgi:hypothetical protein
MRGCLLLVIATLAGCGGVTAPLPSPGARGGAVFHLWEVGQGEPVGVLADGVIPHGLEFSRVDLDRIVVRLPLGAQGRDGMLVVTSPLADVEPSDGARGPGRITLHTPVHLVGILQGAALSGRADTAVIDRATRTLTMTNLELVHLGTITRAEVATVDQHRQLRASRLAKLAAPPAVAGALAALPVGLPIPPLRLALPEAR